MTKLCLAFTCCPQWLFFSKNCFIKNSFLWEKVSFHLCWMLPSISKITPASYWWNVFAIRLQNNFPSTFPSAICLESTKFDWDVARLESSHPDLEKEHFLQCVTQKYFKITPFLEEVALFCQVLQRAVPNNQTLIFCGLFLAISIMSVQWNQSIIDC